jgi:hypothetical protein
MVTPGSDVALLGGAARAAIAEARETPGDAGSGAQTAGSTY